MDLMISEMLMVCRNKEHIYIYGAGKNAGNTYHFLNGRNIKVEGFLVSDMSGNPPTLLGCTVSGIDSFSESSGYVILVPAFRNMKSYKEIYDCLMDRQVRNVYFMTENLLEFIKQEVVEQKLRELFNTGAYHYGETTPVEMGHGVLVMRNAGGKECHWRFGKKMISEQCSGSVSDVFPKHSALEEFENQYGTYHVLQMDASVKDDNQNTYAVYMARSHVDKASLPDNLPSWIIPIQVGAALTNANICVVKDNTGEHISERNGNYSECTAIYWMWKNAPKTDYIGLCHYRRHFDLDEDEIKQMAAAGVDVLVTAPAFVYQTVGTFFEEHIPKTDMKVMLEVMQKIHPDYAASAEEFLSSRFYPPCNLFVMRYDLFMEYSEFVFSVTFGIEKFYNGIEFYRKDRYIGFIIECLLGIFLMKNKERLKTAYTDMRFYL